MHFALIAKRFYMQEDHSIVYYNAFVSTFISSDIFENKTQTFDKYSFNGNHVYAKAIKN